MAVSPSFSGRRPIKMLDRRRHQFYKGLAFDRLTISGEIPLQEGLQQYPEQSASCPRRSRGESTTSSRSYDESLTGSLTTTITQPEEFS